jgi:site-specific DNA-methyltransferase (adenine-specific)
MHLDEAHAWLARQESESIDALVTDPPYSSGGFTRGDRMSDARAKYARGAESPAGFGGDNRDQRAMLAWCSMWLTGGRRACVTGAPVAVFSDWRQLPLMTDALQVAGFIWRGVVSWTKKNASRPAMGRFRADSEFVAWGSAGPMPFARGVGVLPGSIACAPVTASRRVHLTEKPVEVMASLVAVAPPGALVCDPFAGSGSTGVACLQTGRRFVGVEQDPHYFAVACDRLEAAERGAREGRRPPTPDSAGGSKAGGRPFSRSGGPEKIAGCEQKRT